MWTLLYLNGTSIEALTFSDILWRWATVRFSCQPNTSDVCVSANTTLIFLPLSQRFSVYVTTLITFCSVCIHVCVCLSQNIISVSEYVFLWIPLPVTLFCPLFHKPFSLFSKVRWHFISYIYISVSFLLFSKVSMPLWLTVSKAFMLTTAVPVTVSLLKTSFLVFSSVRSHQKYPNVKR